MSEFPTMAGCACCSVSRRSFLAAGTAACAGLILPRALRAAEGDAKARIRIVHSLHGPQQTGPDWPNVGFDFRPVMERVQAELGARCPGVEFVANLATGPDQAKKIIEADAAAPVDGYIVFQMNCWNQVVQTVATTGKPVLYADFQYGGSGGFLVYTAGFLRAKTGNVGFVGSSRIEDLADAVRCFAEIRKGTPASDFGVLVARTRAKNTPGAKASDVKADPVKTLSTDECVRRLAASKILAVRGPEAGPSAKHLGIQVDTIPFSEVNEAWKAADKDESRAVAARWKKDAKAVIGVSDETLETSAAMYLAQKAVMKKHGASGITINCLGGFYGGHIHAYPCLGFHELCNEGFVGACECDVRSATTMLALTTLTGGRPGYISDPVIDTSRRQIIYAHCVASNRVFGPTGETNPYEILTHSEDRQGASVRSVLPVGLMTTTVEFDAGRKELLFHQGKAVENVDDDRACRTKLAVEPVGDIEKLFTQWDQWGWHRVTCYGDLKEPLVALAGALGFKVVEEA